MAISVTGADFYLSIKISIIFINIDKSLKMLKSQENKKFRLLAPKASAFRPQNFFYFLFKFIQINTALKLIMGENFIRVRKITGSLA